MLNFHNFKELLILTRNDTAKAVQVLIEQSANDANLELNKPVTIMLTSQ